MTHNLVLVLHTKCHATLMTLSWKICHQTSTEFTLNLLVEKKKELGILVLTCKSMGYKHGVQ